VAEFTNPFLEQLKAQMDAANLPLFGVDLAAGAEPVVMVQKKGYLVQFTNEQLSCVTPVQVLPPEVQAFNREVALERARQEVAAVTLRLATAHTALAPVIDLHSPEVSRGGLYCLGCDAGAYAEDDPEWPCRTIELILDGLGPHMGPRVDCGKRYMDGRNEVRCWLPEAHDGPCK